MKRLKEFLSTPRCLVFAGFLALSFVIIFWAVQNLLLSERVSGPFKDWPTYENREFGFRIRYPSHWTYSIHGYVSPEDHYEMLFCDPSIMDPCYGGEHPFIGLAVLTNPKRLSMEEWAQAQLISSPGYHILYFESYEVVRTLEIAGVEALRLVTTSPESISIDHRILIPLPEQDKILMLFYYIDPPAVEPFFELMALTVEFIP